MRRILRILAVGVACSCMALLGACTSDEDGTTPAAPAPSSQAPSRSAPGGVFTFGRDDLCEWITADEAAVFFTSVYGIDVTGTADPSVDSSDIGPDECRWRLTPTTSGPVDFYELGFGNAESLPMLPIDEVVEYEGGTVPATGGTVSGHPALSEGVMVQSEGWGIYAFWVPPTDQYLSVYLNDRVGTAASDVDSVTGSQARVDAQTRFFTFADLMLQELGWVPAPAGTTPVPVDEGQVEITYATDGTSFAGDHQIIEGPVTVTFVNETDSEALVAVFRYETGSPALAQELEFLDEGERSVPGGPLPVEGWSMPTSPMKVTSCRGRSPGRWIWYPAPTCSMSAPRTSWPQGYGEPP